MVFKTWRILEHETISWWSPSPVKDKLVWSDLTKSIGGIYPEGIRNDSLITSFPTFMKPKDSIFGGWFGDRTTMTGSTLLKKNGSKAESIFDWALYTEEDHLYSPDR